MQDGPADAFPLGEQPAAFRMLFLSNAEENEFAVLDPLFGAFVPDRHMLTTASSP